MSPSHYFTDFFYTSPIRCLARNHLSRATLRMPHAIMYVSRHRNTEQAHQGTQPYRNHTAASKRHALKTTYSSGLYTTPPESQLLPQTRIQIYERARTHVLMTDSATHHSLTYSYVIPEIHLTSALTLHVQMLAHPFTISFSIDQAHFDESSLSRIVPLTHDMVLLLSRPTCGVHPIQHPLRSTAPGLTRFSRSGVRHVRIDAAPMPRIQHAVYLACGAFSMRCI
jgi:hypothetical protein